MPFLTAAVILLGALFLTDLLLTFGVIRRLREHTAILNEHQSGGVVTRLSAGEHPSQFTGVSTGGESVTGPAGLRVAAFFSSMCSICPGRVPAFTDYLRANHIDRDHVLAVIDGPGAESVLYLDDLAEMAFVCLESGDGELAKAFQVSGYPAFCLLNEDGSVQAASHDPAALPELVQV